LEDRITRHGFEPTMEAIAYTWFNRFAAIRFMELHGYLEHGYRVLSHPDPDKPIPEILEHAAQVELPGLNPNTVIALKLDGTRDPELYRMLVLAQCNALHAAMPFLFERIDDETELLLPENLLHSDSLIRKLVNGIDEEDWQDVEIIGWLYESYISEKYEQVIGKVVKSEDIPAATQRFTPNWIVKYLVQNSLGRQWLATYPDSPLKQQMEYYIEPAEQTREVQAQLKAITPESLNPEELTLLDPACGSGHILVEAYDLFKAIYQERGYRARDIPALILQKNLFGLEIDDRAAQLAAFALMMKARADDRRIFTNGVQPHVLVIQESKGLNAQQFTEALNIPILKTERLPSEYLFEELEEERVPLFSRKNLSVKGDIAQTDVAQLIALFEHGKTFGSLIRIPENLAEKLPAIGERVQDVLAYGGLLEQAAARSVEPLIEQAQSLAQKYDCVVTNPPYMGGKYFHERLKEFITQEYKEGKADLYACFMLRNIRFTNPNGFVSMITIPNWMFLSSFESVRQSLFDFQTIDSFIHNGRGVFGSDFGSCSFVIRNQTLPAYRGVFRRLFEKQGSVASNEALERKFFEVKNYLVSPADFTRIPGSPVAYWASETVRLLFAYHKPLDEIAALRQGMSSGNGEKYVRHWHEVNFAKCQLPVRELPPHHSQILRKWYPYNKGGPFRKWYGNRDYVINFENDGETMKNDAASGQNKGYRMVSKDWFFRSGITWTDVSSSFLGARLLGTGFIFENTGSMIFPRSAPKEAILGFLCSKISSHLMGMLNPTVHFTVGEIKKLPFCYPGDRIIEVVHTLIRKHKEDWDGLETSWDFQHFSLCFIADMSEKIEVAFEKWTRHCSSIIATARALEEENNRLFIDAYGLQDELSPEVPDDQITLYRPNREEDIKRLISYAIGCMMGRYSLDKPGLIYAHSGNTDFDPSQYSTFPADSDGIIPIMETDWFPDDASNRLVEFISVAWLKEHLAENLTFIAESLGPTRSEQSQETIRRYFATGFYKHHLQMYKRRPIYWLFSSGKQRAFQCLVYLHRYHEGTLARMRTEYVIPLQGKIAARIDQLADDIAAASSTAYRKKLEKERETLRKQHTELQAFDEQLRHYADRRIRLDLDDGVKVNYGKFGDLLAEVKAVTGDTAET
jgi:hypothetical protein